jgi:hypothetical protein
MNADWFSRDHLSALAGLRWFPTLQVIISTVTHYGYQCMDYKFPDLATLDLAFS